MKIPLYNWEGKIAGDLEVSEKIFGSKWNPNLVHQALAALTANRRKPLAQTKGRSEVRGGGKKPWRQKGTGRARHGSIRSPLWRGGGVTHGPSKERRYERKLNKKMRKAALFSVISKKLSEEELKVLDSLNPGKEKTKALNLKLKQFLAKPKASNGLSVLLVPARGSRLIFRISRNLPKVKSLSPESLNVEDLLRHKNVLIERSAVNEIK